MVAAYGYLAYLVRVHPKSRTRDLQRLSSIGHEGQDLLAEIRSEFVSIGTSYYSNDNKAEGFRFRSADPHGRSLYIRVRRGPQGSLGETYDLDTGTSTETTERIALLSELRAAVFVPENAYYGLLFVERAGGRHAKDLIYQRVLVPIAKRLDVLIRVEGFAEVEDWRVELAPQQVLRVSEVLTPKDSSGDASTTSDLVVKVQAEGAPLRAISDSIKERVFDLLSRRHQKYRLLADIAPYENRRRVWGEIGGSNPRQDYKPAPKSVFTIADSAELDALKLQLDALNTAPESSKLLSDLMAVVPVDRTDLESQKIEVALGEDKPEKTFVVEGDSVPQLVYPLGERLIDITLQRTWEAQAERFLRSLGVTIPRAWLLNETKGTK